jgi:hypothetical protein
MSLDAVQTSPFVPRVRTPGIDLDAPVPRRWFGGNAVATHLVNGINLLFPAGERFFVRSVKHYLDEITDPVLRAQIKGFFGQEGRHAKEHERLFRLLVDQGYDVDRFLRLYERIAYGVIEKLSPPALSLATTAACEHYTAILAETVLDSDVLDGAHPTVRALLLWHACEEIEHRAVAFDVLRQVSPSYAVRMAGLGMATLMLSGFWAMATLMLMAQDDSVPGASLRDDFAVVRQRQRKHGVFARGIREYLRPSFHPSQKDTDGLAAAYLASVGLV